MKKKFSVLAQLLLCVLVMRSQHIQHPDNLKALSIGDTMPNLFIEDISNYKVKNVHFEEFKDKLVIIDFWFGACPGCIAAFPKFEALQKKFEDKVQVIMVNFESQKKIDETLNSEQNKILGIQNFLTPYLLKQIKLFKGHFEQKIGEEKENSQKLVENLDKAHKDIEELRKELKEEEELVDIKDRRIDGLTDKINDLGKQIEKGQKAIKNLKKQNQRLNRNIGE